MEYSDTEQVIDQLIEFPITHANAVERIGSIEITSPSGDSVTVREVLDPVEEESYPTPDALYAAIVGNLDETFIGRKYYDDRGNTTLRNGTDDEPALSF